MSIERVAVDANVLVYAHYRDSPQHSASRAFLGRAGRGQLEICFTSQILAEFFSIVTSAKRVSDPRTPQEAVAAIEALLAFPGTLVLPSPSGVTSRWLELVRSRPVRAGAIFDLQFAATVMANGIRRICTFNRQDFDYIPGLEVLVL